MIRSRLIRYVVVYMWSYICGRSNKMAFCSVVQTLKSAFVSNVGMGSFIHLELFELNGPVPD